MKTFIPTSYFKARDQCSMVRTKHLECMTFSRRTDRHTCTHNHDCSGGQLLYSCGSHRLIFIHHKKKQKKNERYCQVRTCTCTTVHLSLTFRRNKAGKEEGTALDKPVFEGEVNGLGRSGCSGSHSACILSCERAIANTVIVPWSGVHVAENSSAAVGELVLGSADVQMRRRYHLPSRPSRYDCICFESIHVYSCISTPDPMHGHVQQ